MLSLVHLPFTLSSQIFKNLTIEDKKTLSLTCKATYRWLRKMQYGNQLAAKVVSFIIENCDILASSLPIEDLKLFPFHKVKLLELGEDHTNNAHRYLNALLTSLFWRTNSCLFIEGGDQSLAYFKANGEGQFEYMTHTIIQGAKTWDIPFCAEYLRHLKNSLDFAKSTVRVTKATLNLSFDRNQFSLKSYLHFIRRYFDSIQHSAIYDRFPFLKFRKRWHNYKFSQSLLNRLNYLTINLILYKKNCLTQFYFKEMMHFSKIRELHMVNNFYKHVFCEHKSAVFIAGKSHLNGEVFSHAQAMQRQYKRQNCGALTDLAPILFLSPRTSVTIESINNSFERHFDNAPSQLDPASSSTPPLTAQNESIEFIKDCIKNCDEAAIDIDKNHFGLWQLRCYQYLSHEKAKLQKLLLS